MKWYQKTGWIILLLIVFFPVGLFLMWKYAGWKKPAKWIVTAVIALAVIVPSPKGGTEPPSVPDTTTPIPSSSASTAPTDASADASSAAASAMPVMAAPSEAPEATPDISGKLAVHYLDVGQADCIYLQLPDGQTMLIDAGDIGEGPTIRNYLKEQGCTTLDYVIATHPHADHIGGMADIISNMDVKSFYMPKVEHTSKTFEDMIDAVASKELKINVAAAGKSIPSENGLVMNFVAPVSASYDNLNDYSAVLKLTFGDTSFLFTGDAEALSEGQITTDVQAGVLKVGHHGSDTSTSADFLAKVHPKYAVISVGTGNTYGHPADSTVQALNDAGAIVYRTDLDGTIVFTSDGSTITVDKEPSPVKINTPSAGNDTGDGNKADKSAYDDTPNSKTEVAVNPEENKQSSVQYVWITATGTKYHSIPNCGSTKSASEITLDQAISQGYDACKRCH